MADWDGVERRSGRERRVKRVYRFIDRRSGFDRRRRYPVLGTMRDHPWILVVVLLAMNIFSLLDGLLTAAELATGVAREGNPVLAAVVRQTPLGAAALKVGMMVFVSLMFWHLRRNRAVLAISLVALAAFAALLAYHFGSLSGLGFI